ncbi:hypothetical protein BEH_17575 [Priestia filamentosa]|uniref:GS catalytic domain-containing protein n=1 Tax=Priestia filamentosa TaxID=1402861 RepID=A0A0H4KLJ9_9BACI|nr:hypothetical protein BEH_17575 [Priestia filamentosa]
MKKLRDIGHRPEFFLFQLDKKGDPAVELNDKGEYFDLAPTNLDENCLQDTMLEFKEMSFEVEASHSEVALVQHDPAANPYLAITVMLAAGLDRIKNKLTPSKPINRNIYVMNKPEREKEGISDLPATLAATLEELK